MQHHPVVDRPSDRLTHLTPHTHTPQPRINTPYQYDRLHNLRGDDQTTARLSPFYLLLQPSSASTAAIPTTTAAATLLATSLQAPLVPLTLPAAWPATNAPVPPSTLRWSALTDPGLPPHIHLLSLGEPAFAPTAAPPATSSSRRVMLQLQHLVCERDGGRSTTIALDLGRLLLPSRTGGAAVASVEARTLTGAFAAAEGGGGSGGCGEMKWEEGVMGGQVRVTIAPGGFCTLEVEVVIAGAGREGEEDGGVSGPVVASPFAH
jgi:hypothetical protein